MKQIFFFLIAIVTLLQFNSCVSSQAFAKAVYINNDAVYLPKEKIADAAIIAIYNTVDKGIYENIVTNLQSALTEKNINSDKYFFSDDGTTDITKTGIDKGFQIIITPIKDSYITDEMNNPVLSKQITVSVQKSTGEKVAAISIAIDRTQKESKMGNDIAGLISGYLKKKKFI